MGRKLSLIADEIRGLCIEVAAVFLGRRVVVEFGKGCFVECWTRK